MKVTQVVEYIQQLEQVNTFINHQIRSAEVNSTEIHKIQYQQNAELIENCKFCGSSHPARKCPAYGKVCACCQKMNHYAKV